MLGMGEDIEQREVGLVRLEGEVDRKFKLEKHSSNTYLRQGALRVVYIVEL